ncbi:hypothetical protein Cgig2_002561 [Carnegiea gigantea]|uniref:Uncharacterized protein n=1 Tax=Carnegiea gigantea TaxID=171969 RepID=A0A9Q1GNM4_9CARY|nr:hypothetical protein Cgig2_002561 [Carnegiea gigantea]
MLQHQEVTLKQPMMPRPIQYSLSGLLMQKTVWMTGAAIQLVKPDLHSLRTVLLAIPWGFGCSSSGFHLAKGREAAISAPNSPNLAHKRVSELGLSSDSGDGPCFSAFSSDGCACLPSPSTDPCVSLCLGRSVCVSTDCAGLPSPATINSGVSYLWRSLSPAALTATSLSSFWRKQPRPTSQGTTTTVAALRN